MSVQVDVSKVEVTSYQHCMVLVLSLMPSIVLVKFSIIFIISPVWSVEGANYKVFLIFELDSDKYQFTVVVVFCLYNLAYIVY